MYVSGDGVEVGVDVPGGLDEAGPVGAARREGGLQLPRHLTHQLPNEASHKDRRG